MSTVTFHDLVQQHRAEKQRQQAHQEALLSARKAEAMRVIETQAKALGLVVIDGGSDSESLIYDRGGALQYYGGWVRPLHWTSGGFWMFVDRIDAVCVAKDARSYSFVSLSDTDKVAEFFAEQEVAHQKDVAESRAKAEHIASQYAYELRTYRLNPKEVKDKLDYLMEVFPEREQEWKEASAVWSARRNDDLRQEREEAERKLYLQQVAEEYAQALLAHRRQAAYIAGVNEAILANIQQELAVAVPYYELHYAYVGINEEGDPGVITDTAVVLDAAPDANGWWRQVKWGKISRVQFPNIGKVVEMGYATPINPAYVLVNEDGVYTDPRQPEQAETVRQQLELALLPSPLMPDAPAELADEYDLRRWALNESSRLFDEETGQA